MRSIIVATLITLGAITAQSSAAQAGGWTNTGGLAWFK